MTSTRTWYTTKEIKEEHKNLPIRQVYLWFITSDNQIVIVGRGPKWQFPGGKPEEGESIREAMKREVYEEAGLILDDYQEKPQFFGYYLLENDANPKWPSGDPYLQVRYFVKVNKEAKDIRLSVNERDDDLDTLEEAKFVPLQSLPEHIVWMDDSREEYVEVKKLIEKSYDFYL